MTTTALLPDARAPLDHATAEAAFGAILDGQVEESEIARFLTAMAERDETSIDQNRQHVEIHRPDGVPDLLQQIEHGTLMLIAQHRVFGHAIPGIVEPDLGQYTHLGDAVTKTDGKVDDPNDPDSPRDDRLEDRRGGGPLGRRAAHRCRRDRLCQYRAANRRRERPANPHRRDG